MEDHSQDKTSEIVNFPISYEAIKDSPPNENRFFQLLIVDPYKADSIKNTSFQLEHVANDSRNIELIKTKPIKIIQVINYDSNTEQIIKEQSQSIQILCNDSSYKKDIREQNTRVSFLSFKLKSLTKFYDSKMLANKNDRKQFIIKVYVLIFTQLLCTIAIVSTFTMIKTLRENIINYYTSIVCIILCIILGILSICFKKIFKKYPYNYIFLYLFTFLFSYPIAYYSSHYSILGVVSSIFVASGVSGSLAIGAYITKKDFTMIRGLSIGFTSGILFFALSLSFSYTSISQVGFGMIFISIFVFYLVWDLQLICGGRHSYINYDDYVISALLIYVDICALFLYILSAKR
ncbi:hypothetical protein SteCoe_24056 [Stentor coeruleus]|uniref:Uncharacterized protein n=1 Tax=Stentor coeruleus TaxID=5963 RepID=A0A1R2BIL5_9CILI|nr:hypothetical protein SteCoe_24056 [Stentor coeruleus]